jgi:hypothetical protein
VDKNVTNQPRLRVRGRIWERLRKPFGQGEVITLFGDSDQVTATHSESETALEPPKPGEDAHAGQDLSAGDEAVEVARASDEICLDQQPADPADLDSADTDSSGMENEAEGEPEVGHESPAHSEVVDELPAFFEVAADSLTDVEPANDQETSFSFSPAYHDPQQTYIQTCLFGGVPNLGGN